MLKIIDVNDPKRLEGGPLKAISLLENPITYQKFLIKKIELRKYKINEKNNTNSLITAFVETDKGSVEITYDENSMYDSIESAKKFLIEQLGLSSLILRCTLILEFELQKN